MAPTAVTAFHPLDVAKAQLSSRYLLCLCLTAPKATRSTCVPTAVITRDPDCWGVVRAELLPSPAHGHGKNPAL